MSKRPPPAPAPVVPKSMRNRFVEFSKATSGAVGSVWVFMSAILLIIVWALTGPLFHYSDTWQLVINTGTSVVTFLMVFLIQSTQNRDAKAIHLKLDELVRALKGARNHFVDLESLSEEELERLAAEFTEFRAKVCSVKAGRNPVTEAKLHSIERAADETIN